MTTADSLGQQLRKPLLDALGNRFGEFQVSILSQASAVADGTTVFLLRDPGGESRAVVLCSAPLAPDMVERTMRRARQAKIILGPSAGAHILDPLLEGRVGELSFAALPYCKQLSGSGPVWWVQRALVRRRVLDWLWCMTEQTVRDVDPTCTDQSFAEPLRHLASQKQMGDALQAAAERAAQRLDTRAWMPKHVLMHGDLWKGNILIRPQSLAGEERGWGRRFVVIDWAGSETQGYAIYDLVRWAQSMGLSAGRLRFELERHCRVLRCDPADATGYLMAALGHIGLELEHFPFDRYARMADSCLTTLQLALG
ncbi:MAG: hypothetical protein ACN4G0_07210 [Polyangiales bacterium]